MIDLIVEIYSGDWTMPEEINRLATDAVTNWFFTTSETANANLRQSGVAEDRIFFVGNTMIDTLLYNLPRFRKPDIWDQNGLREKQFFVLILHRPGNVEQEKTLKQTRQACQIRCRCFKESRGHCHDNC